MPHRVYIVEDHDMMRRTMEMYVDRADDLDVVGSSSNAEAALDEMRELEPDVALVDVSLPQMSGIELVDTLKSQDAGVLCLILSGHAEEAYVRGAREAGAHGYLIKGRPDEYLQAIREVLDGNAYCSRDVAPEWNAAAPAKG